MNENNQESNEKLYDLVKKQLFYQRISTCCIAGILLVAIIVAVVMVPKVNKTVDHVNEAIAQVNTVANKAEKSLENVDVMVEGIIKATDNMNSLVEENAEEITQATKSMSEIDFEGLNKAISDLQTAVAPLVTFFSKFR
jgi:methyl-accepting chemotaxis protein